MSIQAILLVGLFVLMIMLAAWALFKQRKLYGKYFHFWIILAVMFVPVVGQDFEELPPDVTMTADPYPIVFPDVMPKAIAELDAMLYNMADHNKFLSDWWPCPLNNSSVLNLTA
jgi:hypothetical protein